MRISATCSGFIVALACAAAVCARADEIGVVAARLAASEAGLAEARASPSADT